MTSALLPSADAALAWYFVAHLGLLCIDPGIRYVRAHLGLEVRLDRRRAAGVTLDVAAVDEGDIRGIAALRIRLRVPLAVSHRVAVIVEQRAFDGDPPVGEVVGTEHLREVRVGLVERVVEAQDAVAARGVDLASLRAEVLADLRPERIPNAEVDG